MLGNFTAEGIQQPNTATQLKFDYASMLATCGLADPTCGPRRPWKGPQVLPVWIA